MVQSSRQKARKRWETELRTYVRPYYSQGRNIKERRDKNNGRSRRQRRSSPPRTAAQSASYLVPSSPICVRSGRKQNMFQTHVKRRIDCDSCLWNEKLGSTWLCLTDDKGTLTHTVCNLRHVCRRLRYKTSVDDDDDDDDDEEEEEQLQLVYGLTRGVLLSLAARKG